jgi:hypothetical protein
VDAALEQRAAARHRRVVAGPLSAPPLRRAYRLEVGRAQEGGLLHDHVLAPLERLDGEVEVRVGRRRHHHDVHPGVLHRRAVAAERAGAAVLAAELLGERETPAGVPPAQIGKTLQRAAVPAGDVAAAEEREVKR